MSSASAKKSLTLRQRGIGLIESVLTIGVGISIIAGGISYFETADRQQTITDLYSSFSYVKGVLESDRSRGSKLPLGTLSSSYNMVPLPGFSIQTDGQITHKWTQNVEFRHFGDYVVSFSLEGVSGDRCAAIMTQTVDQVRNEGYKSIAMVNGRLFTGVSSGMLPELITECKTSPMADVGWVYAPSIQSAVVRTGLVLASGESVEAPASPTIPVVVPETTAPTEGPLTGGTGFTPTEPSPSPEPVVTVPTGPVEPVEPVEPVLPPPLPVAPGPVVADPTPAPVVPAPVPAPAPVVVPPAPAPAPVIVEPAPAPVTPSAPPVTTVATPSWPKTFVDQDFKGVLIPGPLTLSPLWDSTITSFKFDTTAGVRYRIYGDGNPIALGTDGKYAAEGTFSKDSKIKFDAPYCGKTHTMYIEMDNGIRYVMKVSRPVWSILYGLLKPNYC